MIWIVNNPERDWQKQAYATFENWINEFSNLHLLLHEKETVYNYNSIMKAVYLDSQNSLDFTNSFQDLCVNLRNDSANLSTLIKVKITLNFDECNCEDCTKDKEMTKRYLQDIEETNQSLNNL